jgi:hypothetical protein
MPSRTKCILMISSVVQVESATVMEVDPAVIDTLSGLQKLVVNRHLPTVLDWLRVVAKVGQTAAHWGTAAVGCRDWARLHSHRLGKLLSNRNIISHFACQIGPIVSYWFGQYGG